MPRTRHLLAGVIPAAALAIALTAPAPAAAATSSCTTVGAAGGVVVRGIAVTTPAGRPLVPPCRDARLLAVAARNRLAYGNLLTWAQSVPGGVWECRGGRNDRTRRAAVECVPGGPARAGVAVAVRTTLT